MTNARPNRSDRPGSTTLEDPGTAQTLLFIGWIPPAVTAFIGGVVVALTSANLAALPVVFIGGTVVGYVASLTLLFTLGWYLERRRVRGKAARAFLLLDVVLGVVGAGAVAILASRELMLALQATALAIGVVVVAVVLFVITDARASH